MPLRVVLDTNVLVSAAGYPEGTPARILDAWESGEFRLILSNYILGELVRVLPRLPKHRLSEEKADRFAQVLLLRSEIVIPLDCNESELRDPKDLKVLGTLLAAPADYLITGDKDLLALSHKYPILTPAAFWKRHGS